MPDVPVTLLFPGGAAALEQIEVDRDWSYFGSGLRAWVAQTYLRLRAAGYPIAVDSEPPAKGIVVYHPDYLGSDSASDLFGQPATITVALRADRVPQDQADFEILQNSCFADGKRHHFMTHWPQPGLLPRDPDRERRIESVAFKGHDSELHRDLRGQRWLAFTHQNGLRWTADAASFRGPSIDYAGVAWNDFREVDLILALRPKDRALSMATPATKLLNAWQAGVPALLGPERSYRELRRSPFDYLEVSDAETAIAAIQHLRHRTSVYAAMVESGLARSKEFTVDRITSRWAQLLFEIIPAAARSDSITKRRRIPVVSLVARRRIRERLLGALARWTLRRTPPSPWPESRNIP